MLAVVVLALSLVPLLTAHAILVTSPPRNIQTGDITTTSILDGTILGADLANPFNYTGYRFGIASATPTATFAVEQGSSSPVFWVGDEGTSSPSIVVAGNGGVALGGTSPVADTLKVGFTSLTLSAVTTVNLANDVRLNNAGNNEYRFFRSAGVLGGIDTIIGLSPEPGGAGYFRGTTGTVLQVGTGVNIPLVFTVNDTERMRLSINGGFGHGTSSPFAPFQVASSGPNVRGQLALTDPSANTNQKHWLFSSQGGNLYVGTTTDAYATTTPPGMTILNDGRTGFGTTSPATRLSVDNGDIYTPNAIGVGKATTSPGNLLVTNYLQVNGTASTTNLIVSGTCTNCVSTYATTSAPTSCSANNTCTAIAYCDSPDIAIAGGMVNTDPTGGQYFNVEQDQRNNASSWLIVTRSATANARTTSAVAICMNQ